MHTFALMYINFSLDVQKDFGKDSVDLSSDDFTMGKFKSIKRKKRIPKSKIIYTFNDIQIR